MLELRRGAIRIDGIDISHLSREAIRQSMTTLPQDPIILSGSVRQNLDPEGRLASDDPSFETMLAKVGLLTAVLARGGLTADFSSMRFSTGEQQLFCLARAALHKSRVILLDEAMSGIDQTTEEKMRTFLSQEFKLSTVIEVAHRLDAIVKYDIVVVMDDGQIAEMGNPRDLLSRNSMFRRLCEGGQH